jgi:AraC-like DNA-binding protein
MQPCAFCDTVKHFFNDDEICKKTHLYGLYQAERFGGKYIFFCPLTFMHWVSPLVVNGVIRGALLGGPIIPVQDENFFQEEIAARFKLSEQEEKRLFKWFETIPYVDPARVTSLSEMLYVVSRFVSKGSDDVYEYTEKQLEQSSRISEYVQYIKSVSESERRIPEYPIDKEKELQDLIQRGEKAAAQKLLNEILGHVFFASGRKLDIIKSRIMELVVLLSRAALAGGAEAEQIFGLNYRYLSQINKIENVDDLAFWLSKIMQRFTDYVFILKEVKHVDVMKKSIAFMQRNYMNKLSLEEVAEKVHLSPSYFSRIFKSEMKSNFIGYLNMLRIEKAKRLLISSRIPLIDVATMVGYEDQSYFTKVFKKQVGVSPGKFRESQGYPVDLSVQEQTSNGG